MTTQTKAAKEGKITEEMRIVARDEHQPPKSIRQRLAEGTVIITRNAKRENVHPLGIGKGLSTKINANIGTSPDLCNPALEIEKAKIAAKYGADTIMDLSTGGDLDKIRKAIIRSVNAPIGTVPIYQTAIEVAKKKGSIIHMTEDDVFKTIEKHAKDGVDFMTLHCGVTQQIVNRLAKHPRLMGVVSRGGTFLAAWILHHKKENPLYANFDYLLEIAAQYDFALSLGDGLRPGCIFDSTDWPPFYVLGPVVTEIAPGYDHIVGAIGGAVAGVAGADFLCYLTPSEHLGLPNLEDVKEGVITTKIAAHAVDIVKLGSKATSRDLAMAEARANLNWKKQIENALDPEKATKIRSRVKLKSPETCSMCSEYCAIKILREAMKAQGQCL